LNHLAPVYLPAIKLTPSEPWLIGAITYLRDEQGQHADLVLMPKEAFLPEPVGDLGLVLESDLQQNNPAATPNPPAPGSGF
jgi:hypothetical protein